MVTATIGKKEPERKEAVFVQIGPVNYPRIEVVESLLNIKQVAVGNLLPALAIAPVLALLVHGFI